MRFIPMREDVDGLDPYRSGNTLQWEAFEGLQPGQVLVVDSYRTATAASGGDMLMTRAWKRGAAAVVTDGGLRDGQVLAKLPFPTYASQVTITTRAAQHHVADLNVPIGCAGVAVYPGDVLVGDRDGVLVIPRHLAAEIAEQGLEQEQLEAYVSTKIHAGEPLWGNYPPGEETNAEYKALRRRRTMADRHRVVVVGGGFGGLNAVRGLDGADVDVTLVDRTNHHLFQPLLYQVATGILPPGLIAPALRGGDQRGGQRAHAAGRGVTTSTSSTKVVHAHGPDGRPLRLPYDTLVVAAGATHSYFGNDHFAEFAAGHEDHRGRPVPARRDPGEVRDGRDRDRPAGTRRLADLRRDRRRAHRCGAGRADRRAGPHGAAAGLPLGEHPRGADHPAGGRAGRAAAVRTRSCSATRSGRWRRWASRSGSTPSPWTWTTTASRSRARTASRRSRPAPGSGRRACRRPRWPGCSARRSGVADRPGRAASRWSPTASYPGTRRSSRSATWSR